MNLLFIIACFQVIIAYTFYKIGYSYRNHEVQRNPITFNIEGEPIFRVKENPNGGWMIKYYNKSRVTEY